jgi:hypothetical protein|tara:strand:+ start:830 stop:1000 length:171 start_codon:yes stop_codon:yes gene_type:complete
MKAEDDDPSDDWSDHILVVIKNVERIKEKEKEKKKDDTTTDTSEESLRYVWLPFRR